MASNIEIAKKAYDLFKRGEVATLLKEVVDDNCQWFTPGPTDKIPWAGHHRGKQSIAGVFEQLGKHLEFAEFTPTTMMESGDTVVVTGTSRGRSRTTGREFKNEWAHVAKYSAEGKLVFFQEYMDTAAFVAALSA